MSKGSIPNFLNPFALVDTILLIPKFSIWSDVIIECLKLGSEELIGQMPLA